MSAQKPHKTNIEITAAPVVGHPCRACYFYKILDCTSLDEQDYLNHIFDGGCRGKNAKLKTDTDELQQEVALFSQGSY